MAGKITRTRRALTRLLGRFGTGTAPRAMPVLGAVCISMVRNEQDIIEPFLRHNARFFDLMVILDHGSTDRTRQIIVQVGRELGTVVVTDLPEPGYDQQRFMSQVLRFVQGAVFADTVCFLDADEFVDAPSRAAFDAVAARVPVGSVGLMPWRSFLPDPAISEAAVPDPLARMTWRRAEERPPYAKVLLRMGGRVDPSLVVAQGNHAVRNAAGEKLPAVPSDPVRATSKPTSLPTTRRFT